MIKKERLKELIEEGATIYTFDKKFNGGLFVTDMSFGRLTDYQFENEATIIFYYGLGRIVKELKNLYEHKADAEWDLEFDNVEKRIKFVKPKPFNELGKGSIFLYKNHDFDMKLNIYQCKENGGRLDVYYKDNFIYGNAFNEENYIEACRLIKKLFMEEDK